MDSCNTDQMKKYGYLIISLLMKYPRLLLFPTYSLVLVNLTKKVFRQTFLQLAWKNKKILTDIYRGTT